MLSRFTPNFKDIYSLFSYSYDFLEPYFYQSPIYYRSDKPKEKKSRKSKPNTRVIKNTYYGVKSSIKNGMYGNHITPYMVYEVIYDNQSTVVLHFYSIDDRYIHLNLNGKTNKMFKYIFEYLDMYSELQENKDIINYFSNLKDCKFSYCIG